MYFVTGNQGKFEEAQKFFDFEIKQLELDVPEIQHDEVEEIAIRKAEYAFDQTGEPLFVDDVSLVFSAWGKLPGPYVKYFNQNLGPEGILKLLENEENRMAFAICTVAYKDENGLEIFSGRIEGEVAREVRGENGFGFDSIFHMKELGKTYAELSIEEKNQHSHRAAAFRQMAEYLKNK